MQRARLVPILLFLGAILRAAESAAHHADQEKILPADALLDALAARLKP